MILIGARNEGETYIKVYFTDKNANKFIQNIRENQNWKEFPMNEKLKNRVENFNCFDEKFSIQEVGYWIFFYEIDEVDNQYSVDEYYSNHERKFNFSVAVFNTDTNILSYYELDM